MDQYIVKLARYAQLITRFFAICLSFACLMVAPLAAAQSHISKTSIDSLVGNNTTTLDWKTNEVVIPFDLPETVWVDSVEFLVSARPTGELRQRRNLQLRINGSKPIILKAQGQRFDARVKLETKHLRRRGNKLYLSGISTSPSCPGPNSAGWEISQDRSILVFYGRTMARDLNFRDLNAVWNQNFTAQSANVGLKVMGENSFRHESLITQGVTLRTGIVPKLNNVFSGNKVDIIAGLRSEVLPYIRNEKSRQATGAQIILDETRPPRLIITGDTAEQLRKSVDAFARYKLPLTRRTLTTPNELALQPVLSTNRTELNGTHPLSETGVLTSVNSWLTPTQKFSFDASYASQRTGELLLRMNGSKRIAEDSTLDVTLNGRKLGQTQIDANRKTVRFDILEGYLVGSNNKIEIQPDLRPSPDIDICAVAQTPPQFSLGFGSKITLSKDVDKNINDVSNFAAKSGPFALSDSLVIYGTARNRSERRASLQVIGRLAHLSGQAWTQAQYVEGPRALVPPADNLLIIGPKINAMDSLLANAPKALRLALNGQKTPAIEDEKIASILRVASLNERQAFELAATSARQDAQRLTSGLMALYDDQTSLRTIGVITTRPGASFNTAAKNLLKPAVWNMLKGSVAQWNDSGAVMLQTAQTKSLSSVKSANSLQALRSFNWDGLDHINSDWTESLKNIWYGSSQSIKTKTAALGANISARWNAIFSPSPAAEPKDESPGLRPVLPSVEAPQQPVAAIPVPIVKPKPSLPVKPAAAPSIGLRGSYNPETFTQESLKKVRDLKLLSSFQSSLSSGIKSVTSKSAKAYNDFEAWGDNVNAQRSAQGGLPLVPSPILALLCLLFTGLVLLSIAAPHQRRD